MADAPRFPGLKQINGPAVVPDWAAWLTQQRNQVQVDTFHRVIADDLNRTSKREQKPGEAVVGGPGSLLPLVYGRARIESGKIFAVANDSFNATFGVAWCIGEVEEVVSVTINDIAPPSGVDVYNYTGTALQTADATLVAAITDYDDDLSGVCYSVIVIPWNAEIAGFPIFGAEIKGKKILVGEGGSPTYTENPAYILRDFLSSSTYGLGVTVDWTSTNASATHCDDAVDLDPGPGTEKRHELNVVLNQSLPALDWVNNLRDYARLFVVPEGASYKIIPDIEGTSVKTFDEDNIVAGSLRISHPGFGGDPTMIEVVYTDKSQIPYAQASYTTAAATPRRLSRISRPGILRYSEAVRYAEDRLQDLSGRLEISWATFDEALAIQAGDIVTIDHAVGLYNRMVRVIAIDPISPGLWKITSVPAPSSLSGLAPPDPVKLPPLGPPVIDWSDGTPWDIYGRPAPTSDESAYLKFDVFPIDVGTTSATTTTFKTVPATYYQIVLTYQGPNPTGLDIVPIVTGAPEGYLTIIDPYDGSGSLERGYGYIFNVISGTVEYDASQLGRTFTIQARTSDSSYITPPVIINITDYHDPMIVAPSSWSTSYITYDPFTVTFGDTYPAYQAGADDFVAIAIYPYGYDWAGPTANITWNVTQTSGSTLPLTVSFHEDWTWKAQRSLSTDYSGTAYEIQFYTNSGADEFGPLITLTCES